MIKLDSTIPDVLEQAVNHWPDKIAIEDGTLSLSYQALQDKAQQVARALIANDIKPGDTFCIWAPNIHEWIWTAIGGHLAGAILVPLNTRYKGIEASDIIKRSGAKILFTVSGFLDTDYPALLNDQDCGELNQIVLLRGDDKTHVGIDDFLKDGSAVTDAQLAQASSAQSADAISDIMYTSGTTGAPKGVLSTHGQVVAITKEWSRAVGLNKNDRYLIVNPFFHSFGYKSGWLACLVTGATILPEAVFDTHKILKRIETDRISMLPGAPTIFQSILNDSALASTDLSSLRCAVTGAAMVPVDLVREMKNTLGFSNVYTGYGLTECVVVSICQDGDDFETIANTAGKPLPATELKVVDEQDQQVAAGALGNIKVRGYNVMQGYYNDDTATANTIDDEGWLDTGDIGWQDENGYVKVTDRVKDMFICGGFNCYPAEIENLLLRHPNILDVAVVGMPDERMGEVGQAYIVCKNSEVADTNELHNWAKENMANYKVPRQFNLVTELPRNASGKVMKFKLNTDQ